MVGELALELKKSDELLGMRRGPYVRVAVRNAALLDRIRELKAEHPFWGLPPEFRFRLSVIQKKLRIRRLAAVGQDVDLAHESEVGTEWAK